MMGSNLVEFLTSKEILIVYLIAGIACLVCFIIYLIERNNEKLKQRHNTRELNKLVEQIKEETYVYDEEEIEYEKPILETIEYGTDEVGSVADLVAQTIESSRREQEEVLKNEEIIECFEDIVPAESTYVEEYSEPVALAVQAVEPVEMVEEVVEEIKEEVVAPTFEELLAETPAIEIESLEELDEVYEQEELVYTDIEPDQETAKLELKKIQEELNKHETIEETQNIVLTNYEEQQEEAAIISLDELLKKGKEMYEKNEITQYEDEGNEPISLQDLERKYGEKKENYDEPFIIEEVVPENTEKVEIEELIIEEEAKVEVKEEKKFTISPVISPIYGLQSAPSVSELELENTADYEKLDEEIKKTNDFLNTLKELQNKLDNNN